MRTWARTTSSACPRAAPSTSSGRRRGSPRRRATGAASATTDKRLLMAANDGYERYYTEKLWQMLPELYRTEDGGGTDGDPLRQKDVLRQLIEGVSKKSADRDESGSLPARP